MITYDNKKKIETNLKTFFYYNKHNKNMMVNKNINMIRNQKYTDIISGEYSPP